MNEENIVYVEQKFLRNKGIKNIRDFVNALLKNIAGKLDIGASAPADPFATNVLALLHPDTGKVVGYVYFNLKVDEQVWAAVEDKTSGHLLLVAFEKLTR